MNGDAVLIFLVFLLACAAAATPGLVFRPGDWYRDLNKPAWRPPNWLFGPVWLVLYITIAVSGWLVWRQSGSADTVWALTVYAFHLVLNGLWSAVFFGLQRPGLGFAEIVVLWLSILATIVLFYSIDPTAAYLLVPYAGWVTFAVALNYRVWRLNA
jgi:tryptophan-rich sensory protein